MHRTPYLDVGRMTEPALFERALTLVSWARYSVYETVRERDNHLNELRFILIELRDRGHQLSFL